MQLFIGVSYLIVVALHLYIAIVNHSYWYFLTAAIFIACSILSFLTWRKDKRLELERFFRVWKCPYFCEHHKNDVCARPKNDKSVCYNDSHFVLKTDLQKLPKKELLKEIAKVKKIHDKNMY